MTEPIQIIDHEDKVVVIKAKQLDLEAEEINFKGRVLALEAIEERIVQLEVKLALLTNPSISSKKEE